MDLGMMMPMLLPTLTSLRMNTVPTRVSRTLGQVNRESSA